MAKEKKLSIFEKYLTVWVVFCIVGGIILGKIAPGVAIALDNMSIYQVSIPIAICLMICISASEYPFLMRVALLYRKTASGVFRD